MQLVTFIAATSVRKHLELEEDDLHLQNKFNKQEFFTSMLYETLPPVIGSPLLALFLEGPTRAYHLINHRLFLPTDKSYQKTNNGGIIYIWWIMVIPMNFLIHIGIWGGIFFHDQLNIDMWEPFLALLAFLCRNMILSIKYAYYSDEELEGVRSPAPDWTDAHQFRKLIGNGWRFPLEHEGLVEEELNLAQELIDVHLGAPSFKLQNKEVAKYLRR